MQHLPATFPLQHLPEVGSDWLERRLDVTPWTGRGGAQDWEVRKVASMWSSPACERD